MADRDSRGFWQAPLPPVAAALTAGIVLDEFLTIPVLFSLALLVVALAAWLSLSRADMPTFALFVLLLAVAAGGAGYRQWRGATPADDIGRFAGPEPRPVVVRGFLAEAPRPVALSGQDSPFRSYAVATTATRCVLRVTQIKRQDDWTPASGLARLTAAGTLRDVRLGDEVEVVGRLIRPSGPSNPGEFDYAAYLDGQQIHALIHTRGTADSVTVLSEGSAWSVPRLLGSLRGYWQQVLRQLLPKEQQGLAAALLLGEESALEPAEWQKYQETGVVAALAISGQHLVILGAFLLILLRPAGLSLRPRTVVVALLLLGYALLTGGRPPAMRAAAMVCAVALCLLLGRKPSLPNVFALAWVGVLAINPNDFFNAGCQLSFVAVALLAWGMRERPAEEPDPLDQLIERSRPAWLRALRTAARGLAILFAVNALIWLAVSPLVARHYNLAAPVAVLIGPPVLILTTIALLAGFLALLTAPLLWPVAEGCAWLLRVSLAWTEAVVDLGRQVPGAYWYVPDVPEWWVVAFYTGLFAWLTIPALRQRGRWLAVAGLAWLCLGLALSAYRPSSGELRVTFLAVGHGGCTVLETPDGRTVLYDAGAMAGPDVTRRHIAPFLWHRGVRRIDEVILSHADLDHYNGLKALTQRFAIGHVTLTPSFQERRILPVDLTLRVLDERAIPVRIVRAGHRITFGEVTLDVLHPPEKGPEGNENARSLVLLVQHEGHTVLLTGDLEGPGLARVLSLPPPGRVDVLMAPHHGSPSSNGPELAKWAAPTLVISSQGAPRWARRDPNPYEAAGAPFLTTWEHGAVTVRSSADGLLVETFRTGKTMRLR